MADRNTRDAFCKLIDVIDQRRTILTTYGKTSVIGFTLDECKAEFLCGEEHSAMDLLIDNLHEFRFPLTPEIYEALNELGKAVQYPADRLEILQRLTS